MLPTKALTNTIGPLLAADAAILGNATAMKVGLITNEFTPSLGMVMGDLTLAAGNGLDPLAMTAGAQNESVDPITAEIVVEVKPPAGGARWESSGGFVGPTTIHGFALGNNAMTVLIGVSKLPTPVTLTALNQAIVCEDLEFRMDPTQIH